MIERFLSLWPADAGRLSLCLAVVGLLAGVTLWLTGARFSRSILVLGAVAVGTSVGVRLPGWCGWTVDPAGVAVGAAVVLGVSAFAFHRVWVGVCLGTVIAGWGAFFMWKAFDCPAIAWPGQGWSLGMMPGYLAGVWGGLPQNMQIYLPVVWVGAAAVGITACLRWPRMGAAMMWSAAGATLAAVTGMVAMASLAPAVLERFHGPVWPPYAALSAGVLIGAFVQWRSIRGQADGGGKSGGGGKSRGKSAAAA